jgi:hypothetical protein
MPPPLLFFSPVELVKALFSVLRSPLADYADAPTHSDLRLDPLWTSPPRRTAWPEGDSDTEDSATSDDENEDGGGVEDEYDNGDGGDGGGGSDGDGPYCRGGGSEGGIGAGSGEGQGGSARGRNRSNSARSRNGGQLYPYGYASAGQRPTSCLLVLTLVRVFPLFCSYLSLSYPSSLFFSCPSPSIVLLLRTCSMAL